MKYLLLIIMLSGCGYSLQASVSFVPDTVSGSQLNQETRPASTTDLEAKKEDLI